MLDRMACGALPEKPHLVFRGDGENLLYEHCLTRDGFDGPFSILYHRQRPHEAELEAPVVSFPLAQTVSDTRLVRRHYRSLELARSEPDRGTVASRIPLLFSADIVLGLARAAAPDPCYFGNADGDELFYVISGAGCLRSPFGELSYHAGDYLCVPKGVLYRFEPRAQHALLTLECRHLSLPPRYRNVAGQLRMDAPYSHRDFRRPSFNGPSDEGVRSCVIKRAGTFHGYRSQHSPLDVVGWDGSVYPFAFPISAFQARVGQTHLPPPAHATFEGDGVLICSFVPRLLDFHPRANPAPYPHSSVDMDEVLFYANSAFTSRRGVALGSISHHPAGIPHGPHPGAYEQAPGQTRTEELAVMFDCRLPLNATPFAQTVEDTGYHSSFRAAST